MTRIKVGITGQNGFIGSHLRWHLELAPDRYEVIPFEKYFFQSQTALDTFITKCDVIVHLAALNRHEDPQVIHDTNLLLTSLLIDSLERTAVKPYVIFSSSTQELNDNLYGISKRACADALTDWANTSGGSFSSLIIPNVYGPFARPYYNTFISTFCHQLVNDEKPQINGSSEVSLIYIGELANFILSLITTKTGVDSIVERRKVDASKTTTVSEVFDKLYYYKNTYFDKGVIPALESDFELNLFNTFRSHMDHANIYPRKYVKHSDNRGCFVELLRLETGGQVSYSSTMPTITRGNHYHTRKIERFSVVSGSARIELRKIDEEEVLYFDLNGGEPSYVDMPVWYTHNITNTGENELLTVFWINEFFDPNDPDTYFLKV